MYLQSLTIKAILCYSLIESSNIMFEPFGTGDNPFGYLVLNEWILHQQLFKVCKQIADFYWRVLQHSFLKKDENYIYYDRNMSHIFISFEATFINNLFAL